MAWTTFCPDKPVYKILQEPFGNFGVHKHSSADREQTHKFLLQYLSPGGLKRTQKKFQRDWKEKETFTL